MTDKLKWKLKEKDCIFFLHIPKTAGTTFYTALQEKFGSEAVLILPDEKKTIENFFATASDEKVEKIRFYRQHANYSTYQYFRRKPVFITMLRNPIARVYSFYKHVLRVHDHKDHEIVVRQGISLFDFVSKFSSNETSNLQVKWLVGGKKSEHSQMSNTDMLEIAKMRLHEFAFYGIAEEFDLSMQLLAYTFGWDKLVYESQNQAPTPTLLSNLSSSEIELIAEKNQLDQALYEYATVLFEQRVAAM